jgi:hypothetical protein
MHPFSFPLALIVNGWYLIGGVVCALVLVGLWVSRRPYLNKPYQRLAAVALLSIPIVGRLPPLWTDYWLAFDAQRSLAVITKEHSHGVVDYRYVVNKAEYLGCSMRNWDEPKFRDVGVGQESVVFFSSSHLWLSSLEAPGFSAHTAIPTFIVIMLEMAFTAALIRDLPLWLRALQENKSTRLFETAGD